MSTAAIVAIIAALVIIGLVVAFVLTRTARLRRRFGPEYDEAVREAGGARRAESILEARTRRVARYHIHALRREEHDRFATGWRQLQSRFIDDPAGSVKEADRLVTDLMAARGYPMTDFDRQAEDLSVDHPRVVGHYRDAHAIAMRQSRREASTEDLRQAFVHYRLLFDDLLESREPVRKHA